MNARALFLSCAILLVLTGWQSWLVQELASLGSEASRVQARIAAEFHHLRETMVAEADAKQAEIARLRDEVALVRQQAAADAAAAQRAALRRAALLTSRLDEQRRRQQEHIDRELDGAWAAATTATEAAVELDGEVRSVLNGAGDTRWEIAEVAAGLSSAARRNGFASGLVTAHSLGIAVLASLNGRDYLEFELMKSTGPLRVGGVEVLLRRTDPRRHKYSIELVAGEQRIEEKDRDVNEPVRFYVDPEPLAYELVVREIGKDQIRGYLAVPRTGD